MTLSLHTYDVGQFGHIMVPSSPLAGVGLSHWMITTVVSNLLAGDQPLKSLGDEVFHAVEYYLDITHASVTEEELMYVYEQTMCYYVTVENYFQQYKLVEHLATPTNQPGVAVILKD